MPGVDGPIIVGGGSAADHHVQLGSNVHIGPGVVIGGPESPHAPATDRVDFDPRRFDPIAYLPKARAAARRILDDVELTEFEMYENVWPDGRVDLTAPTKSTSYYEFRSPSRSKRGRPDEVHACYVMVYLTTTHVETQVRSDKTCDHALHTPPRCRLAEVWARAKRQQQPATGPATIGFLHDGTWFFDLHHSGVVPGASTLSFGDDCR